MEMRAQLLIGLEHWLERSRPTQTQAAKVLSVTQAPVSELKRRKVDRFSMDLLVRLAARAGLKPKPKGAAYALRTPRCQSPNGNLAVLSSQDQMAPARPLLRVATAPITMRRYA
jgi:predicted XRE-type DNA-binding protein